MNRKRVFLCSAFLFALAFFFAAPTPASAAAVTNLSTTTVTTNAASYTTASFTPTANDLLVVYVLATATVVPGAVTDTQSLGFTFIASSTKAASADQIYLFVANNLAAASSMTVTFTCTGDAASGADIQVLRVSGMTHTGASAVRQTKASQNQAAAGTPSATFSSAALTGNPTVGFVGNATSPATLTPPTGWTERGDAGYSTPTTGAEYVTRDSGFTGTAMTWGNTSASAFGVLIAELDASTASAPTITTGTANSFTTASAELFGTITATGGASPTSRGFAISTNSGLASGVSTTSESGTFGTGSFNTSSTTLSNSQTYYYRAYATNSGGTGYGSIKSFTTGNTTPSRKIRLFEGYKIRIVSGTMKIYQQ